MVAIGRGAEAPDFNLPGIEGDHEGTWTLSSLRGRPVVLVFYPGDNTPVCTRQLNAYDGDIERFAALDAQVLAISPQSVASHREFSDRHKGFGFPLLADEDKSVGALYGVLGPLGFYRRSVFVISRDGEISWLHRATAGLTYRPVEELVAAVSAAH